MIFIPIKPSNILEFLSGEIEVEKIKYRFLLVVFITNEEHLIWSEKGHDALMDFFTLSNKDLVAIGTVEPKGQRP